MNRIQLLSGAALCALALSAPAARAQSFDQVVKRVESRLGIHRMNSGGMGFLVNAVLTFKKPEGSGSMKVAVFDEDSGLGALRPNAFQDAVRAELGSDWRPLLTVRSKRNRESVTAYVHLNSSTCEMMVATNEQDEGTLIQLRLDGRKMLDWLADNLSGKNSGSDREQ